MDVREIQFHQKELEAYRRRKQMQATLVPGVTSEYNAKENFIGSSANYEDNLVNFKKIQIHDKLKNDDSKIDNINASEVLALQKSNEEPQIVESILPEINNKQSALSLYQNAIKNKRNQR